MRPSYGERISRHPECEAPVQGLHPREKAKRFIKKWTGYTWVKKTYQALKDWFGYLKVGRKKIHVHYGSTTYQANDWLRCKIREWRKIPEE